MIRGLHYLQPALDAYARTHLTNIYIGHPFQIIIYN